MGLAWSSEPKTEHTSFYDLSCKCIDGEDFNFSDLHGDVVMVTNVASAWGKTKSHYAEMTTLGASHGPRGLRIIGFPCNQFLGQESKSHADIKAFAGRKGFSHSPSRRGSNAFSEPVSPKADDDVGSAPEPPASSAVVPASPASGGYFSLMEKVNVNGAQTHPVFLFLKQSCPDVAIRWNFGAYFLISRDGQVEGFGGATPASLTERVDALCSAPPPSS